VQFTASEPDGGSIPLETATIGPVTASDRENQTGLLERSTTGTVPASARYALVTLTNTLIAGSLSDGYSDNLSLVLD